MKRVEGVQYPARRRHAVGALGLGVGPLLAGCGLFGFLTPPSTLTIQASPTGCGSKVDATHTNNWTVRFTVSDANPEAAVQWFFSDGTTAVGPTVVHRFDSRQSTPVEFSVTVTAGADTARETLEIHLRGEPDGEADTDGDTCVPDEGKSHASVGTSICYRANPPASGPHVSAAGGEAPTPPGFFDEALPTENWVHNLEHGGIVLLYDCGGTCSEDLKAQLRALFDSVPPEPLFGQKKMTITRYAGVAPSPCTGTSSFPASGPFLAIAWDVQRPFATLDTAAILDFYARHVNQGREDEPIAQP